MPSYISADFATRQDRYTASRRFIRDVLLRGLAFRLLVQVDVQGLEHIPPAGPTLLMINHINGIDPVVVMGVVGPRFAVPMSKIENFHIPVVRQLFQWWGVYPVQRGAVDRTALQNTVDLLQAGNLVLISPEGTRHPALIEGKDGITYVAIKANATVVPIGIDGTREFWHNLKRLRQTHITVRIGRAFRFRTNGRERIPRAEMSQMTQEAMYQLAMLLPENRRGFYSDLSKASTEMLEFVEQS
jgi:1-acyl-sn-glycerol-3-phosphate acyltransferase